jgi:signal transduction histidine kinase
MGKKKGASKPKPKESLHLSVIIAFVSLLFTFTLWQEYHNAERAFDQQVTSTIILILGTLFSGAAGLLGWSLESRRTNLEKEVLKRTQELHQKNEELLERNEEVENFIHIISHDLKAPLVSIQGFASMMKEEMGDTLQQGSVGDYFGRIVANCKQMNTLIVELLEFSRVGRVEDEKETVDMKELFTELLAKLRPEINKKNIEIAMTGNFISLWGSRKRLSQVFQNLVQNAVKYIGTPPAPRIEIGCDEGANGNCQLWVKDNGVGIKLEFQQKIFQIFQRAPSTQKIEGTGIGLSIVKKIVEHNHGEAWVKSEEGKGSQFFVSWPKPHAEGLGEAKAA